MFLFITARQQSCGKVMLSVVCVSVSVHGEGLIKHDALNLTMQGPSQTCSNLFSCTGTTKPQPSLRLVSGRHASYWNAFCGNKSLRNIFAQRRKIEKIFWRRSKWCRFIFQVSFFWFSQSDHSSIKTILNCTQTNPFSLKNLNLWSQPFVYTI